MVIRNIRMQTAAGWYVGSVEIVEGEVEPYDRQSMYYPKEEWLKNDYPDTMSLVEFWKKYSRWIDD